MNQIKSKELISLINSTYVEVHSIKKQIKSVNILPKEFCKLEKTLNLYKYYLADKKQEINFDGLCFILADNNIFLKAREKIPNHGDQIDIQAKLNCNNIFLIANKNIEIVEAIIEVRATKDINRVPLFSGYNYIDTDSENLLAEILSFGKEELASSKLVVDTESPKAKWHLNFQHLIPDGHVADNIIIKCREPIELTAVSISV